MMDKIKAGPKGTQYYMVSYRSPATLKPASFTEQTIAGVNKAVADLLENNTKQIRVAAWVGGSPFDGGHAVDLWSDETPRQKNPIVNKRLAKLADAAARRSVAPAGEKMTEAKARKILENEDYLPWAEVRAAREFLGVKAPTAAEIWAEAQASKTPRRNPATKLPAKTADVRGAARRYMDFTGHAPGVVGEVNIKIPKAVAVIGSCDGILYTTVRDGKTERYIHEFKKADAPTFTVAPDGKGIFLIGGRYDFTERGIVDASDPTSPRKRRR